MDNLLVQFALMTKREREKVLKCARLTVTATQGRISFQSALEMVLSARCDRFDRDNGIVRAAR